MRNVVATNFVGVEFCMFEKLKTNGLLCPSLIRTYNEIERKSYVPLFLQYILY